MAVARIDVSVCPRDRSEEQLALFLLLEMMLLLELLELLLELLLVEERSELFEFV